MKLTQLAAKPQLVKVIVDDEAIVEKYKEPLEFWIYDRQPIEQFVKMAALTADNVGEIIKIVNELILDEDGSMVLKEGEVLPTDVLMATVNKVVATLGK